MSGRLKRVPIKKTEDREVRVWAKFGDQALNEAMEKKEKATSLSRKYQRSLMLDMEKAGKKQATVSEVYSPPRVAKLAGERGMKQGASIDLHTGCNLRSLYSPFQA